METHSQPSNARRTNLWRIARWSTAGALLLAPLIAMQFTDEVVWTPLDFVFMGTLFAGVLGSYELLAAKTGNLAYRAGVGIALLAAFLLVWLSGAVSIIGNDGNDADVMYLGVLAIGVVGSIVARFEPSGMARALFAMAGAQALVAGIAIVGDMGAEAPGWPWDLVILTGFFCGLFALAGGLLRVAADGRSAAA
jgi:hypothetical protein